MIEYLYCSDCKQLLLDPDEYKICKECAGTKDTGAWKKFWKEEADV